MAAFTGGPPLSQVREVHSKGNVALARLAQAESHFAAAVALPGVRGQGGYQVRSRAAAAELLRRDAS